MTNKFARSRVWLYLQIVLIQMFVNIFRPDIDWVIIRKLFDTIWKNTPIAKPHF